jgi:tRNA (guanine37-N1)-methyltransferase
MRPEPLCACLDAVIAAAAAEGRARPRIIFLCPQGRRLDQNWARELAGVNDAAQQQAAPDSPATGGTGLVLVCGRYEAIDERVHLLYQDDRLSIGDYVLSGGEPAAIVVIDVLTRLQPGALGCGTSAHMDSFSPGNNGLLDAPHYTRPEEFRGLRVPEVLLSGNHDRIARWRAAQGLERTWRWRPDLLSQSLPLRDFAGTGRSSHEDVIDNESKLNE